MKITVHIKPGSRSESIQWVENLFGEKTLVVKIREKPIDGEANRGLIKALSLFFKAPQSRITILHGHTSREKVVEINTD
ncbi:MAG: DUF167 domain-containing protein [Candidatus Gracilibacteria bacterium]